jgi:hypothetical protein
MWHQPNSATERARWPPRPAHPLKDDRRRPSFQAIALQPFSQLTRMRQGAIEVWHYWVFIGYSPWQWRAFPGRVPKSRVAVHQTYNPRGNPGALVLGREDRPGRAPGQSEYLCLCAKRNKSGSDQRFANLADLGRKWQSKAAIRSTPTSGRAVTRSGFFGPYFSGGFAVTGSGSIYQAMEQHQFDGSVCGPKK